MSHIEDGQALINFLTLHSGAGGEPKFHHNFVLLNVVSDHALFGSYLKKSGHVQQTKAFDIDGSTKLVNTVVSVWVDFLHGCALMKIIRVNNCVDLLVSPPVDKVCEHQLHLGQVKFSRATKPQQIMVIKVDKF